MRVILRVPFRFKLTQPQHQRIQCNIREWHWTVLNSYLSVHSKPALVGHLGLDCPEYSQYLPWEMSEYGRAGQVDQDLPFKPRSRLSNLEEPETFHISIDCTVLCLTSRQLFRTFDCKGLTEKHRCDATLKERRNTAKKYSAVPDRIVWVLCDTRGREGLVSFYIWNTLHSTGTAVDQRFSRDMLWVCQCLWWISWMETISRMATLSCLIN